MDELVKTRNWPIWSLDNEALSTGDSRTIDKGRCCSLCIGLPGQDDERIGETGMLQKIKVVSGCV